MTKRLPLLLLILFTISAKAQNMDVLERDKLVRELADAKADSTRALTNPTVRISSVQVP